MSVDFAPFEQAPGFTFFHSRAWIEALLAAFPGWRDASCRVRLPDGREALLPLLQTDRVGPWRWLEAMPFAFFGGPLVEAGDLSGADLACILGQVGRGAGWLAVNLDPLDPLARPGAIMAGETRLTTHLLALEGDFEAVWRGFSKTARYDIRRAERQGVSARRGRGPQDFRACFALTQKAAARWGLAGPPHPAPLYQALATLPEERISLWLAEFEGQVIGGLLNVHYAPGRTLHWASALDTDHAPLNPTKLLQREAIREACERGSAAYHMGPSVGFDGAPLDGVRQAKEALGARPHEYAIAILRQPWAMRARHARTLLRRWLAR